MALAEMVGLSQRVVIHFYHGCAACANDGGGRADCGGRAEVEGVKAGQGELVEAGPELYPDLDSFVVDRYQEESGASGGIGGARVSGERGPVLPLRTPVKASRLSSIGNIHCGDCPLLLGLLPIQGANNLESNARQRKGSLGFVHGGRRGRQGPVNVDSERFHEGRGAGKSTIPGGRKLVR